MNDFFSSNEYLNNNNNINTIINQFSNNICNKHNKEYSLYCKTCLIDICQFCINIHNDHQLINYQFILPKNEEIKLLFDSIKKYYDDYKKLLKEIFKWKKELDDMIVYFQEQLKNKKIFENINFIFNYNNFKINYNSILKFRQIFSSVIGPYNRKNNNQILNYMTKEYNINEQFYNENKMGLFDYNNYSMMKFSLDKIKGENNDIINFLNNSNLIVKLLYDMWICFQNENNIYNNKRMYNRNNIYSLSDGNLFSKKININLINKNNYDNKETKNIIDNFIGISNINQTNKMNNIDNNMTNNYLYPTKIGNIFLEQNNLELKLSNNKNKNIYKKSISQTKKNRKNLKNLNFTNPLSNSFNRNIYHKKSIVSGKNNKENKSNVYTFNNDNDKIYIDKYVPNIKAQSKKYLIKNNLEKTYVHKKFENINIKQIYQMNNLEENKYISYFPKLSLSGDKSEKNKLEEQEDNNLNLSCDNTLNNTFAETIKKKLNFDLYYTSGNISPSLKKELFQKPYYKKKNINVEISERKYIKNTYDPSLTNINDNNNNLEIIKNAFNKKYIIDSNKPLFIGLELGNSNCKLCFINENDENKKIELFCFKENCYSIPTFLYFNKDKDEVEIGYKALDNLIINPSRTIFNIMKIFGKNYNEIIFNQNLYPFKLFYNDNIYSRPFIKMDFENKKERKLYFEDLFTLYIKKLFEIFFEEFEIENKDKKLNQNLIQISLVIAVPDNFNYFQRKILEKLFQTQIFPENIEITNNNPENKNENLSIGSSKSSTSLSSSKNKSRKTIYGGYQISLKKIKIENNSSIATLSLKSINNIQRNVLLININGDSVNLSLSSIYEEKDNEKNNLRYIYHIEKEKYIEIGEEDFIDNYIEHNLKLNIEQNENINGLNLNDMYYLRKKIYDIIPNINENNEENSLDENKNIKKDFIKSLKNIYNQIILSIKKMIKNEKINENTINSILLIGTLSKTNLFIQMLKKLFKYNKYILNQLSNIETMSIFSLDYINEIHDDYYITSGAAIQSYNIGITNIQYYLEDICPLSFGIESLDGMMKFIIEKGEKIPIINQRFIKIKKNNENSNKENYLEINIYEGENKEVNKNKLISSVNIDKKNFKNEKICNNYIELLIQFEIDKKFNLRVFVLEPKSLKRRFECLINIDIYKG